MNRRSFLKLGGAFAASAALKAATPLAGAEDAIGRVNRALNYGAGGYKLVLDRISR